MTKEQVKEILVSKGFEIKEETRTGNDLGTVYRLTNGCIVNSWDSGKVNCQGKNKADVEALLKKDSESTGQRTCSSNSKTSNKRVFVVYGHNTNARAQLEAMLRRWELEPIILDQLVSTGQTVIEKLDEYISQANFGIVLMTPDDIGYAKEDKSKMKYRARQNVILEMGMLLGKIGRSKVAILFSQAEDMELPSDINGYIYIPFKDNVEDAKNSLAKELDKNGYTISIGNL